MKTATSYSFRTLLTLALSLAFAVPTLAQQPQQVGGKPVETGIYQGRQIQYVARQISVERVPSATRAQLAQTLAQSHGATVVEDFDRLGWGTVELPQGKSVLSAISALERSPLVEAAEPNAVGQLIYAPGNPIHAPVNPAPSTAKSALSVKIPTVNIPTNNADDPYYDGTGPASYEHQWALRNTGQSPPGGTADADIDAPEAWDITTAALTC